ncbi:MAG TPA: NAD(P)/FAD-dependent oxidoreductase [Methanocella sp.]|nr:NAD(P)/FAD-dependent oxidoreductase [Methanocella sp.]
MRDRYDVIVVGAGPAGSAAAKAAAERGLSVLLIEKKQEIGEPVRCAEGITVEGLHGFGEPEPRWICSRIRRAKFFSPGASLSFSDDRDAAYVLERKVFDRDLARMAGAAGAEVLTKTTATGLIVEEGRACGVRGKSLGEDFTARARAVVAADGVESRVGRWAGIDTTLKLKDVASCAQYHLTDLDLDPGCCEFYFGSRYAPGGYAWVFPKGEREANVGLGTVFSGRALRRPIDYLDEFVGMRFPGAHVLETVAGGCPLRGRIPQLSAGGLVLVGDAGRLTDPASGEGILNGMISGRTAGHVIADCIAKADLSAGALLQYDREIEHQLGTALDRNYGLKEFLRQASDAKIDLAVRGLKALKVESVPITRILREVYSPKSKRSAAIFRLLIR